MRVVNDVGIHFDVHETVRGESVGTTRSPYVGDVAFLDLKTGKTVSIRGIAGREFVVLTGTGPMPGVFRVQERINCQAVA